MLRRLIRRSSALAAVAVLVFSGTVLADSVAADGDVASGVQTFVDLGTVGPGETVHRDVGLTLFCAGTRHVDPGQLVDVWQADVTVPAEGGSIVATGTTLGPVPPEWANDAAGAAGCSGAMSVDASVPSQVTIVAPMTPGLDYGFSVNYGRTLAPAGVSDASSINGFTVVTFILDVEEAGIADTTPPVIEGMPGDQDLVTTDPAGTVLAYELPTATDDRDPAPVLACDPAPGALVPVGLTTVTCTATDATGNAAAATFVAVVHIAALEWGEPVGDASLTVSLGRSVPVKARAWLNGAALVGPATFEVSSCGEGVVAAARERVAEAEWQVDAARWMAVIDTTGLALGCHAVGLVHDGLSFGSFTLQVIDPPATGPATGPAKGPPPRPRR
jgi:hypothetical protein